MVRLVQTHPCVYFDSLAYFFDDIHMSFILRSVVEDLSLQVKVYDTCCIPFFL
jgi:hypothetical protein